MHLTLIVPELLWPEPEDQFAWNGLHCPGLNQLLTRAPLARQSRSTFEDSLRTHLGLPDTTAYAPLRLAGEPQPSPFSEGQWLCADPVHLRFHHERIVLVDAGAFDITLDEAQSLADTLNQWSDRPGDWHVATPHRWYLRLTTSLGEASHRASLPLSAVTGRRLSSERPHSEAAASLRHWQNEIQMLLHTHPVNENRQSRGLPAINGLWLWGAGALPPAKKASGNDLFFTDDPLARGLANQAGYQVKPALATLADLPKLATNAKALVTLENLLAPSRYEQAERWQAALQYLETHWFAPLAQGMPGIRQVSLLSATAYGALSWSVRPSDRWKFWQRPRPIRDLAQKLANPSP